MKTKFQELKKSLLIIIFSLGIFSLIGFSEKAEKICQKVEVIVNADFDNYFVSEEDVQNLMTNNSSDMAEGKFMSEIDLKLCEERIARHKFIKDVQVYKGLNGIIKVEVSQVRPVARIIQSNGPHAYISNEGTVLPFSSKFSARVMLIEGDFIYTMMKPDFFKSEQGKLYKDFFNMVDQDKFWKAQIAQISIKSNGEMFLVPQVGDEMIEFGLPEDAELKLKKLKVFYKDILPMKGYNKYSVVRLKYKDQIICE